MSTEESKTNFAEIYRNELEWIAQRRAEHGLEPGNKIGPVDDPKPTQKSDRDLQSYSLDKDLVGMAVSGGGIRSATFALGILQRIAAAGILHKVDYLSTVSGGGYLGSWLSAWIWRRGFDAAEEGLKPAKYKSLATDDPVEAREIRHLRLYSNYLAPIPSFFSFDGWILIVNYLRNLFLNMSIFVMALLALVFSIRAITDIFTIVHTGEVFAAFDTQSVFSGIQSPLIIAMYFSGILAAYLTGKFASQRKPRTEEGILYNATIPWGITAFLAALVTVCAPWDNVPWDFFPIATDRKFVRILLVFAPLSILAPVILAWCSVKDDDRRLRGAAAGLLTGVAGCLCISFCVYQLYLLNAPTSIEVETPKSESAVLETNDGNSLKEAPPGSDELKGKGKNENRDSIATQSPEEDQDVEDGLSPGAEDKDREPTAVALTATFGMPGFLLSFLVISFVHVGLSGKHMTTLEREWWSGVNSRLAMVALACFLLFGCVIYGPWMVRWLFTTAPIYAAGTGSVGTIILGILSAGSSSDDSKLSGRIFSAVVKIAPILFLAVFAISLSTIATWLFYDIYSMFSDKAGYAFANRVGDTLLTDLDYMETVPLEGSYVPICVILLIPIYVLFQLSNWLGDRIGVNRFSLQSTYENRLTRCYLGASRDRTPDPILNFDPEDDLPFSCLRKPQCDSMAGEENKRGPYYIVNTAVNRKAGDHARIDEAVECENDDEKEEAQEQGDFRSGEQSLAMLERQAESFIFSPFYSGCESTGYFPSRKYANNVSLGTAVALSGAAVSPNMGHYTAGPNRILLTLLNVRTGGWYGNPKHKDAAELENPGQGWDLLSKEFTGETGVEDKYVYISDGGHFENMGVYELIRRRCRVIIAADAGTDHQFHDNLGRLVRQARIDFGVRIEIESFPITPDPQNNNQVLSHFVVGKIHYGDVHTPIGSAPDGADSAELAHQQNVGYIIWFKLGCTGDEAADIDTYRAGHPDFPSQTTVDQFFSESQFEAYRELGEHSGNELFDWLGLEGDTLTKASSREFYNAVHEMYMDLEDAYEDGCASDA
ncbi:MAG: hypothetical protein AAF483_05035 [Planctomycetota bacterium]